MRETFFVLLAAMSMTDAFGVVVNPNNYFETAGEYGLKGPVKTISFKEGREFVSLAFNKEGMLTQAKAYSSMGTTNIYHVIYGRLGNVSRKVLYDFTDTLCVDCKQISHSDKDAVEKCKNNAGFVKDRVKSNITYDYNFNDQLIRMVRTDAADNYNSNITEFKYNQDGQLIEQVSYPQGNQNNRTVKTWSYVGGVLVSDNDFDYKYNNKQQLVEKRAKNSANQSVAYTYFGNGNVSTQYLVGRRDTVFFNEKGDTVEVKGQRAFEYRRPDNQLVPEVKGNCARELIKYNKKRVKTYHQYYNEKGAAVFEKYYDEDGNCVKLVFARGFINRTHNEAEQTVTEQKFIDGKLTNSAVFNKFGVCIKEEKFRFDGTVDETITRESDKYGNVLKEVVVNKKGETTRSCTYSYTYF